MPQKKVKAPTPCGTCGAEFEVYPFQLAKGWGRFCSISCGSASRTRERNASWGGDTITYEAAHYRVLAEKGSATQYTCECGSPAHEWAYTHDDAHQLVCPKGRPYSTDLGKYVPLCRSCHRSKDGNRK